MVTCKKATEMVERNNQKDLSKKELMILKFHLLLCKACKRYELQSRQIDTLLKKYLSSTDKRVKSDEFKHRVIRDFDKESL